MSETDPPRIRIAVVVNSLGIGGAERHVVSLINRMNCREFRISLIYLKDRTDLLPGVDRERCEGGLFCLGVGKGLEWAAVRRLVTHLDAEDIDIVVCTNMFPLGYGWLASKLSARKRRVVEVFHTTRDELRMLVYRPLLWLTDLLVYVCHGQAKYWAKRGVRAKRELVIHNGIDIRRFSQRWSTDDIAATRARFGLSASNYVVGHCAVMRPEKAHTDLLAAVARLRREGMDVKCLLIGDGPHRPHIERYIAEHALTGHVHIVGSTLDVRPYVAACDVMALPSRETFSLAALEAMALGKPMVMTNTGGASEQVTHGEHGLLFNPGDIAGLSQCLRQLSDHAEQGRMGDSATQRVMAEFDVERMVDSFQRTFRELMRPSPAAKPSRLA
jgi:glycosyltransferase involved in cell wall biosynthesis